MVSMQSASEAVRKGLSGLTLTHKLLAGAALIILAMSLLLVGLLTSKPDQIDLLPGSAAADVERARGSLAEAGVKVTSTGGKLLVSVADAAHARAVLAQAGSLPSDKATYFETLIARTDWMNSRQVNERNYNIALQNELARTIGGFRGVSRASVQLSVPEPGGLGASARRASASLAITSDTGAALAQGVVDAAARFVAGSIAGLALENVQVIDTAAGKPRVVTTEDSATSGVALESAQKVEEQTRRKLQDLLAYIPGATVAVTAAVDVTRSVTDTQEYMPLKSGSVQVEKKKVETANSSTEPVAGAEPGFGANQAADINRGSTAAGGKTETSEDNTEFENHIGSKTEHVIDPKGQSTSVAVSVNVPRGYVVKLLKDAAGAAAGGAAAPAGGAAGPTEKDIADRFEKDVKPQVIAAVLPHLRALVAQANPKADAKALQEFISVSMIPMDLPEAPGTATASLLGGLGAGGGGGGGFGLGGGLIDKAVLGVLSVAAMGMMIAMVRKAGKKAPTPTAEELVGLPPALETVGEVIGEAEEGETAMAGIEVGEEEMQAQKVLEQVAELVDKNPDGAGKLIGRWVQVEE